jgi:hypothetical protein
MTAAADKTIIIGLASDLTLAQLKPLFRVLEKVGYQGQPSGSVGAGFSSSQTREPRAVSEGIPGNTGTVVARFDLTLG